MGQRDKLLAKKIYLLVNRCIPPDRDAKGQEYTDIPAL
jgi:hypothetical protein